MPREWREGRWREAPSAAHADRPDLRSGRRSWRRRGAAACAHSDHAARNREGRSVSFLPCPTGGTSPCGAGSPRRPKRSRRSRRRRRLTRATQRRSRGCGSASTPTLWRRRSNSPWRGGRLRGSSNGRPSSGAMSRGSSRPRASASLRGRPRACARRSVRAARCSISARGSVAMRWRSRPPGFR